MAKSNASRRGDKPRKPRPDFPLTANGNGQWSKKIRGRVFYFGPWDDPEGAVSRYLDVRDDLQAGRTPRARQDDRLTVVELCDRFLSRKQDKQQAGEIVLRHFNDYRKTTDRMIRVLGKTSVVEELVPDDFARLRKDITENSLGDEALLNRAARASQLRDRIRQYESILGQALDVCHQNLDIAVQAFSVASAVQDDAEVYDGVFA